MRCDAKDNGKPPWKEVEISLELSECLTGLAEF